MCVHMLPQLQCICTCVAVDHPTYFYVFGLAPHSTFLRVLIFTERKVLPLNFVIWHMSTYSTCRWNMSIVDIKFLNRKKKLVDDPFVL